ncbi:MAG: MFS transporter [Caulobacteraceae bacterium]
MNAKKTASKFIKKNFPALTHNDFRYFWTGQCISLIGTWMQNVGQSWLVYTLTDSPFLTGLIGAVQFLPVMVMSLFAGVIIDKLPKKKIIMITQATAMILALIMAALVFTNTIRYWHIVIIAFLLGCSNTIDMPARQTYMMEITGREDLMNAIALNSAVFNLARIIGPSIGGILLAYAGTGWCFLLNGISFIAVLYGLSRIKTKPYVRTVKSGTNILQEIKDGLRYIKGEILLTKTLLMVTVVGIFVFNFSVLLPVLTKEPLHLDGKAYGALMSSLGIGSLIGALIASGKGRKGPKYLVMFESSISVSILFVLLGLSRTYLLIALILGVVGIFNIQFSTTANSTIQINSSDEYRSRVMSVYTLLFSGVTPFGNLFAGYVSGKFGAPAAYIISGTIIFVLIVLINLFSKFKSRSLSNSGSASA